METTNNMCDPNGGGEPRRRKDGGGAEQQSPSREGSRFSIGRPSPPRSYGRSLSRSSTPNHSPAPSPSTKDRKRSYVRRLSSAANFGGSLGASAARKTWDIAKWVPSALSKSSALQRAGYKFRQSLSTSCLLLVMCVPIIGYLGANIREQNRRMANMEAEKCRTNGRLCLSGDAHVTGRMCTAHQQLPLPWTAGVQYTKRSLRMMGQKQGNGDFGMPFGVMNSEGWPAWESGPLVCIVVTTYNVEKYVGRSLDSILQQTYKNFEVLVVDDASTDQTPPIIEQYAKADRRFRLLGLKQSTSGGAGQPTNIGMDTCSEEAEFVLIVDGDDWMERDALASVVSNALRFHSDVVVADFDTFEQDESSKILQVTDNGDRSGNGSDALPGYLGGQGTYTYTATVDLFNKTSIELFFNHGSEGNEASSSPFTFSPSYDHQHWEKIPPNTPFNVLTHPRVLRVSPVPWRKLYRRAFLDGFGLRFPEGDYFYEDNTFHWLTLGHAARISKIDRVLFHHRRNRKGQTSASYSRRDSVNQQMAGNEGGRSSAGVELRPGEDNASTDDDDTVPVSEQETKEQDEYWMEYYKSSRLGGYFPNIHKIGMKIFTNFQYRNLSPCEKVAVGDVAKTYFNWVRASGWIAGMQKSPQMKEKFKRLLKTAEKHWHEQLVAGGFNVDVGVRRPVWGWFSRKRSDYVKEKKVDLSIILPTKDVADLLPDLLSDLYAGLTRSRLKFEVFVVDDGSTDGTIQILRDFATDHTSTFYLLESGSGKSGAGRARNNALPLVEGEYVYFADTDDTFDFAALAGAVKYAARNDVDMVILPYKTEYVKPGSSTVDGMLSADLKIWNGMRSKWRQWFYPFSDEERKMAAFGLINYPWKQLTSASLLRDAGVFFGPTVVQNDVQFHWTSIAGARNVQFYDKVVCTHRKFDAALRSQLTKVQSSHRLGMLDAAGMTQRAMAQQGAFDGTAGRQTLERWTKFFHSLAHWAKSRVPKESQASFAARRDNFVRALDALEPYSLGKWAYWRASPSSPEQGGTVSQKKTKRRRRGRR